MITKDSFSILISKFSLVYKIILALLIALLVFGIIGYAILAPTLSSFMRDVEDLHVFTAVKEYLSSIFRGVNSDGTQQNGRTEEYEQLVATFKQIGSLIKEHAGQIWGGGIAVVILGLLFFVFYHMCLYTVADTINAFMSSDSEYGFASNFVANIYKSFKFSIAYVGMSIASFIVIAGLSLGLGFLLSAWNNFAGLVLGYFTALLTFSIRRALFAGWRPAYVVSDLTIKESFITNFKMSGRAFKDALGVYFVLYLAALLMFALVGMVTLGFGIIIVVGVATVLNQTYDMVNYYHYCGKKYYRDAQHVVDPTKKYKDAVLDNPIETDLK